MPPDRDCVEYARECVRLAGLAENADMREHFLQLAREWMALAMNERGIPQPKNAVGLREDPAPQMEQQQIGEAERDAC